MSAVLGIVIIVCVGLGACCLVSPKFRALVKGSGNLFLEDVSKTPKGAKIVYTQAIEETRDKYNKSCNVLSNLVGKATELKAELTRVEDKLEKVEQDCVRLAKRQDATGLQLKAQERQALLEKKEALTNALMQLEPSVQEAEKINSQLQIELNKLNVEKEQTLAEMELANQMKDVYAQMDSLRADTGTQKLLASAREGAKEVKRQAVGAQMVHNNRLDTKLSNLDKQLAKDASVDYAQQLLEKYKN